MTAYVNSGALSTSQLQTLVTNSLGVNGTGQITALLLDAVLQGIIASIPNTLDNSQGLIVPNWAGAPQGDTCLGKLTGANFNSTADQAITIICPTSKYQITAVIVANASGSLSGAAGGVYTMTGKTGAQVVPASQSYSSLSSASLNTVGSALKLSTANSDNAAFNLTTLYLSLSSPVGSAATADVYVFGRPLV